MINVSELIGDPDFTQPQGILITRRVYSINNHRPIYTDLTMNVRGIIVADENEDDMGKDIDANSEKIVVLTYDRLKTVGVDKIDGLKYGADVVCFNGNKYKVISCEDHSQYGYCRSYAVKMEVDVM